MRIARIYKNLKCDTVLCFNNAEYELNLGSYKGNSYMCLKCFKKLITLFKRINKNEEQK